MNSGQRTRVVLGAGDRVFGPGPVVMGILNVTPDSFSDGGDFMGFEAAIDHAGKMIGEGAEIIDVGGESTRPGAEPVSAGEEVRRVVPAVREILARRSETVVSVDTYRASTAEAALEAGAHIVNDVTALRGDPRMASLAAGAGCPLILMHMKGEPRSMQAAPHYEDVVGEVRNFLAERADAAVSAGVSPEKIILDPGIGFGKTLKHNLLLIKHLKEIAALGFPVLVGPSRKTFIGRITGAERPKDRLFGTVSATVMAYERGATFLRVHDVRPNRDALAVAAAICEA